MEYWKSKKEEKDALTLERSYKKWKNKLLGMCCRMFEYKGLPFPQKEIELRLFFDGYCGILKDSLSGIMVARGGMSDPTQYEDEFKKFTYSAPTSRGGTKTIDVDCVIIDNDSLRNNFVDTICCYASLLSHAEITIKCSLVNNRNNATFVGNDDNSVKNINLWYDKLYNGNMCAISSDDNFLMSGDESVRNVLGNVTGGITSLQSIESRNEILRMFYNEIGVKYSKEKRGNITDDEVNSDEQMLLFNIDDMLKSRKIGCEKINKMFDLNTSVELTGTFKKLIKGVGEFDGDN